MRSCARSGGDSNPNLRRAAVHGHAALDEQGIRIDRFALPPLAGRGQLLDGEVKMRRVRGCVAARTDEADDVAATELLALDQAWRIPIEMRVVIDPGSGRVVLVDGDAARLAEKQFADRTVDRGQNGSCPWRGDVDRPMFTRPSPLMKHRPQIFPARAYHRNDDRLH